jgi:hypothetical protein
MSKHTVASKKEKKRKISLALQTCGGLSRNRQFSGQKRFHHRQPKLFLKVSVIRPTKFPDRDNPPSIATANAMKNHLFHHRAVQLMVVGGGPVGRAGSDPTSLKALDSLDF